MWQKRSPVQIFAQARREQREEMKKALRGKSVREYLAILKHEPHKAELISEVESESQLSLLPSENQLDLFHDLRQAP